MAEMRAYKAISFVNGRMRSPVVSFYWGGLEIEAECGILERFNGAFNRDGSVNWWHTAPEEECNCGIHACFDCDEAFKWLEMGHKRFCVVVVELSGKVIVHEKGYRAEHAEILGSVSKKRVLPYLEEFAYCAVGKYTYLDGLPIFTGVEKWT